MVRNEKQNTGNRGKNPVRGQSNSAVFCFTPLSPHSSSSGFRRRAGRFSWSLHQVRLHACPHHIPYSHIAHLAHAFHIGVAQLLREFSEGSSRRTHFSPTHRMPQEKNARTKRVHRRQHEDGDDDENGANSSCNDLATDSRTPDDFLRGKKLVHSSLVEIRLDSWYDLAERFGAVRNYLLINFGEIGHILPDPMRQSIPVYKADNNAEFDYLRDVGELSESTDPFGVKRLIAVDRLNGRMERNRQYLKDRIVAYWTIRSVTSRMLDQALSADPAFLLIEESDPIALYQLINKILMISHTETATLVNRPVATPAPSIQNIPNHRSTPATPPQIMYGALMHVTHGTPHTFLITVTHPIGIILVAGVENLSTPALRNSLNRTLGVFLSRGIQIAQFVSDNEKGLSSLFGDNRPPNVEMVTSGLGDYTNRIEAAIRTVKEEVRRSCFYVPFLLSHQMFKLLVVSVSKKTNLFDMLTPARDITPFHALMGRKIDALLDVGSAIFIYCEIKDRVGGALNAKRTVGALYIHPHQTGEGTHLFLRLDNRQLVTAKHYREVPVTAEIIAHVNAWSDPSKVHHYTVPRFIYHGQEVLSNDDDDNDDDISQCDYENEDVMDENEDRFIDPVSEQNNPTYTSERTHHSTGYLVATPLNVIEDFTGGVNF